MILIILITVVILLLCTAYYKFNAKYKDIHKIAGPKPKFLIGNSLEFGSNVIDIFYNSERLIKKYGTCVRMWIGPKLMIMLADPNKIEDILKSNVLIAKSSGYDFFKTLLGEGLVTSKGETWRKHRKIITPTFHFKIVDEFIPFINSNLNILISKLNTEVGKSSFDIFQYINLYALDAISETAMSTKVNAQTEVNSKYVKALHGYIEICVRRMFSLYKRSNFIFSLTKDYATQTEQLTILKGFTNDVIKSRKQTMTNNTSPTATDNFGIKKKIGFLDLLLNLGSNLTDEEIGSEVDTFMFAGHDTVTSVISFALLVLSNHQEIQNKIYAECEEVMGDDKSSEILMEHVKELKYLDIFLKESMRYYTPVPFIERNLEEDYIMDNMKIPKGTTIHMSLHSLHHSEVYYPEPDKFIVERFLPENTVNRHPFAYIPFSAGARNCIGQKYAILVCKASIIKIIRNFKILPVANFKPILCNKAVLNSANGIYVRLENRL